jgi:hypothetical protein
MTAAIGHNVVALRKETTPAKVEYAQAIHLWCQTRNVAETLTASEIGGLEGFSRVDAQRKAIILHLAQYYRLHPRADVAPGVDVVMTLLSDNDQGLCTVSQGTLAKLFNRSRSSIAEAQVRLRDAGTISKSGRGCKAGTYPIIPRVVTTEYNHLTWLVDAICTQDAKEICPATQDNSDMSGAAGHIGELSGTTGHIEMSGTTRQFGGGNVRSNASDMSGPADTTSLSKFTKEKKDPSPPLNSTQPPRDRGGDDDSRSNMFAKVAAVAGGLMTASMSPFAAAAGEPPMPPHVQPVANWNFINPANQEAASEVWFDRDSRIQVAGSFKSELESIIGQGQDLRAELDRAAEWITTEIKPMYLKAKVRGRLQTLAADRRDRDRRYQSSIAAKATSAPVSKKGPPPGFSYAKG